MGDADADDDDAGRAPDGDDREGTPVTLTATVDVNGTNPNVLGGTVTFAFQSYLAQRQHRPGVDLGTAPIAGGDGHERHGIASRRSRYRREW